MMTMTRNQKRVKVGLGNNNFGIDNDSGDEVQSNKGDKTSKKKDEDKSDKDSSFYNDKLDKSDDKKLDGNKINVSSSPAASPKSTKENDKKKRR
jgi:hypothetical protein